MSELKTDNLEIIISHFENWRTGHIGKRRCSEIGEDANLEYRALLAALKQAEDENARLRAEVAAAEERVWNMARDICEKCIANQIRDVLSYDTYAEAKAAKEQGK